MRCFLIALGIVLVGATAVQAEFIQPVSATVTGVNLVDAGVPERLWQDATDASYVQTRPATLAEDAIQWLAQVDPVAASRVYLTLDLGAVRDITGFHAWRYMGFDDNPNEGYRSANKFGIYGSADGSTWNLIHYNDGSSDAVYVKLGHSETDTTTTVQTRTWADMADPAKGNLPTGVYPNKVVNPDNALGIRYIQFQFENCYSGNFGYGIYKVGLGELAFEAAAVPEPGSLSIFACGLAGLLAYAWRRRR